MTFTVVVDADTMKDVATPTEVRAEIERRLRTTSRRWTFKVWPAEEKEPEE